MASMLPYSLSGKILQSCKVKLVHSFFRTSCMAAIYFLNHEAQLVPHKRNNMEFICGRLLGSSGISKALSVPFPLYVMVNYKSSGKHKKPSKSQNVEESDDEEEVVLSTGIDFRDVKVTVQNLRLDAIIKAGANLSRSKVEAAFYSNNLRINGQHPVKKSLDLVEGDEIDVIKRPLPNNSELLEIYRIILLKVVEFDDDGLTIILRKYPKLIVDKEEYH